MAGKTRTEPTPRPLPPGPRGLPIARNYFALRSDPLKLYTRGRDTYGDIVRYRYGTVSLVMLNDPEAIRHVLVTNHENYVRSRSYAGPRLVTGNGMLVTDGEQWRRQRKQAQPAFQRDGLPGFLQTASRQVTKMLEDWDRRSQVDVHVQMLDLALAVMGHWLSRGGLGRPIQDVRRAIGACVRRAYKQIVGPVWLPLWAPSPGNLRYRRARRNLDTMLQELIDEHRKSATGDDVLSILAAGHDPSTGDRALRDAVMTLLATGHETVANCLTWTLMHLSRHPEVADRVRSEVAAACGGQPVAPDHVEALAYTEQVVSESLRLHPPAWHLDREALDDDRIGGYHIPKGTMVGVCLWTLHRHPALWSNPDCFDPDRFAPQRSRERHRYAYIPFGAGPRTCIGSHFGMQEVKLLVASIVQRYAIELGPDPIVPSAKVTLRPRDGMPATVRRLR